MLKSNTPTLTETEVFKSLVEKYDQTSPRYTSFPTANHFSKNFQIKYFLRSVQDSNEDLVPRPLSLYLHIPFCRNICFYCACNKVITRDLKKVSIYIDYLEKEIQLKSKLFDGDRCISQLHFGGGTPSYLSIEQIENILYVIFTYYSLSEKDDLDFSIEIDPRTVNKKYLTELKNIGFNRFSFGVQDLNSDVQTAINRVQSFSQLETLISHSRSLGIESVNLDLMYGLPKQTVASFADTLEDIIKLAPDRISLFNYAHLPERFKPQRRINIDDLPEAADKLNIYLSALTRLKNAGYIYIGMDHFALPHDPLSKAQENNCLHRNFQGYTTHPECDLLAFGVSAIGYLDDCYVQNHHTLEKYYQAIDTTQLPISRGVKLSVDDLIRRYAIMELICHFNIDIKLIENKFDIIFCQYFSYEIESLANMQADGLIVMNDSNIKVTANGRMLIRLICKIFDHYSNKSSDNSHSRVI